ncbi:MAG TPA: HPr family phosphocarrier protein [Candidatus Binataceae bacterium]|nr:HPr family phosphocarrier protein [Candidatus Binataceae bacterium]
MARDNSEAEATVEITNKDGLHIHPSDMVVRTALRFLSSITIALGAEVVSAHSAVGLTTLGAAKGTKLRIRAVGPDAADAVKELVALFEGKFGEE